MEREAVEQFLGGPGQTPDPLAPTDPADVAAFRRLPRSQQRDRAFELMRRAVITMRRDRVVRPGRPAQPAQPDEAERIACEQDVIDAARQSFGITVATGATPR